MVTAALNVLSVVMDLAPPEQVSHSKGGFDYLTPAKASAAGVTALPDEVEDLQQAVDPVYTSGLKFVLQEWTSGGLQVTGREGVGRGAVIYMDLPMRK